MDGTRKLDSTLTPIDAHQDRHDSAFDGDRQALRQGRTERPQAQRRNDKGLLLNWVHSESDLREAQRLRYRVFADEMGARLKGPEGLDVDEFDARCEHLLVRDRETLRVVGTYRILPPQAAPQIAQRYSAQEFDLRRLAVLNSKMVEVGRACVDPDYRSGAVIMTLWAGLAAYMRRWGFESMLGCSSVSMSDGGHHAANLHMRLAQTHTVAPEYHVFPHTPLPVAALCDGGDASAPPLLAAYLRLGARICGAPAWDADFHTADFLTLLRLDDLDMRYAKRFIG
nr:GNAT family N-acyltransferase [Robbsia andropogonis]